MKAKGFDLVAGRQAAPAWLWRRRALSAAALLAGIATTPAGAVRCAAAAAGGSPLCAAAPPPRRAALALGNRRQGRPGRIAAFFGLGREGAGGKRSGESGAVATAPGKPSTGTALLAADGKVAGCEVGGGGAAKERPSGGKTGASKFAGKNVPGQKAVGGVGDTKSCDGGENRAAGCRRPSGGFENETAANASRVGVGASGGAPWTNAGGSTAAGGGADSAALVVAGATATPVKECGKSDLVESCTRSASDGGEHSAVETPTSQLAATSQSAATMQLAATTRLAATNQSAATTQPTSSAAPLPPAPAFLPVPGVRVPAAPESAPATSGAPAPSGAPGVPPLRQRDELLHFVATAGGELARGDAQLRATFSELEALILRALAPVWAAPASICLALGGCARPACRFAPLDEAAAVMLAAATIRDAANTAGGAAGGPPCPLLVRAVRGVAFEFFAEHYARHCDAEHPGGARGRPARAAWLRERGEAAWRRARRGGATATHLQRSQSLRSAAAGDDGGANGTANCGAVVPAALDALAAGDKVVAMLRWADNELIAAELALEQRAGRPRDRPRDRAQGCARSRSQSRPPPETRAPAPPASPLSQGDGRRDGRDLDLLLMIGSDEAYSRALLRVPLVLARLVCARQIAALDAAPAPGTAELRAFFALVMGLADVAHVTHEVCVDRLNWVSRAAAAAAAAVETANRTAEKAAAETASGETVVTSVGEVQTVVGMPQTGAVPPTASNFHSVRDGQCAGKDTRSIILGESIKVVQSQEIDPFATMVESSLAAAAETTGAVQTRENAARVADTAAGANRVRRRCHATTARRSRVAAVHDGAIWALGSAAGGAGGGAADGAENSCSGLDTAAALRPLAVIDAF